MLTLKTLYLINNNIHRKAVQFDFKAVKKVNNETILVNLSTKIFDQIKNIEEEILHNLSIGPVKHGNPI